MEKKPSSSWIDRNEPWCRQNIAQTPIQIKRIQLHTWSQFCQGLFKKQKYKFKELHRLLNWEQQTLPSSEVFFYQFVKLTQDWDTRKYIYHLWK